MQDRLANARFFLRLAGVGIVAWCFADIREDIGRLLAAVAKGFWSYAGSILSWSWTFHADTASFAKAWWYICFAISMYLIFGNRWLAKLLWRGIDDTSGRCAACGYDRSGLEKAAACPECGSRS